MSRTLEALRTAAAFFVLTAAIFMLTVFVDIVTLEKSGITALCELFAFAALPVFELFTENRAAVKRGMDRWIFFLMYCIGYALSLAAAYFWLNHTDISRFFINAEPPEHGYLEHGLDIIFLVMFFGAVWALIFRGAAAFVQAFIIEPILYKVGLKRVLADEAAQEEKTKQWSDKNVLS